MTVRLALFFLAAATLMLELLLTRVFDVILTPNMAYMVVACALFSFGFAGVTVTLQPARFARVKERWLPLLAVVFAASVLALRPALNVVPFDYEAISEHPIGQLLAFSAMYVVLVVPFFVSGLMFTLLFSAGARSIQALYFWDLTGAALGCVLIIPLLRPFGPGGILFITAAFGLIAAALLEPRRRRRILAGAAALVLVVIPTVVPPASMDFVEHLAKRGVKDARLAGAIEFSRWDPISKIDVIDQAG